MDHPLFADNDNSGVGATTELIFKHRRRQTSAISRREAPEAVQEPCPSKNRGRRESRVPAAPAASCALVVWHTSIHHRSTGTPGLPCAMVLTAYFALSSVTGLSCHRRLADYGASRPGWADASPQDLTPASGRQDHTTSPSAANISRQHAVLSLTGKPALRSRRAPNAAASTASRAQRP
jgi:hypothetical protein